MIDPVSVQLRVTSIRNSGKFGGAIFAGMTSAKEYYVAVCDYKIIPDPSLLAKGQQWSVTGTLMQWKDEQQIKVSAAEMLCPSGRNIIDWIAQSEDCAGIGSVKAGTLYRTFGLALIDHINARNIDALTEVLSEKSAHALCDAFAKHNVASTLLWLDRLAIDRRIGKKVVDFYRDHAQQKIEQNPYRLISFAVDWKKVDELARNRFGVTLDDPRRLDAAVEEVLYGGMRDGHTCLPVSMAKTRLVSLLKTQELAGKALSLGEPSTQYYRIGVSLQPAGTYAIEQHIAERLTAIAAGETEGLQMRLGFRDRGRDAVQKAIKEYEAAQGFTLSTEQRNAVMTSAESNLSLIMGGAGTGKTTVLKALYKVLEDAYDYTSIYQVALAGRAAQRMSEATGRESMTIAGFLKKVDGSDLGHNTVVVVDEMSMVDVILMYRMLRHIPPGTKLILVGDPSQLPPIGPGLVLHALAGHPAIEQTELKVTQRQTAESGIPAVARAIREHRVPQFAQYTGKGSGVSFVRCTDSEMVNTVRRVYGDLGGDGSDNSVQILSTTREGFGSAGSINRSFHEEYRRDSAMFFTFDPSYGKVGAQTNDRIPLRVGDLVIYTENDYDLGLRNGSLGTIIDGLDATDAEQPCCACEFEGTRYELNSRQAEALRHAYAITVHKSQGSQFRRVIVPLRRSTLLDQALIYTAVTRGVDQVVLVGDWDAVCAAIEAPAKAARRHVSLPSLMSKPCNTAL
ncbi:ATP-dependent DNA helicase [Noviherbaspirillum malthae]|uniref:ATP-dependent DNA helicase n=1 Tax=Noviherbaspirillum malthae TaxID=1260987 RepID=UPI00188F5FA5|nr:AAA family ATPase [Noviherbaspirillum malthae]